MFRFNGEHSFQIAGNSNFPHEFTIGMGNYKGNALTTGCGDGTKSCAIKTELMDMNTLEWSNGPDFPFAS